MSREWDGKEVRGKIVAGEFVEAGDDQGRPPGTYVTIRFDDPSEGLVAGPVKVTYLPLQNEQVPDGWSVEDLQSLRLQAPESRG